MNTLSMASHGKTIRHTHRAQWSLGSGLNMVTERTGEAERSNLRFDVHDSCDPTAILLLNSIHGEAAQGDSIILNHEQVAALVKAGQAFLEQYPHGIESARRLEAQG